MIDTERNVLIVKKDKLTRINYMIGEEMYKKEISELMKRNEQSKTLPYVTTVEAEIRTETHNPIWVRSPSG